ncbi:fimbrillin family protein [Elizabethkingia anophelis]|uniref:fimbrillin family protein n=3 Tax=Elizabethkingia anophelis TaxID=1117645 RepID=UPI0021AAD7DD|nr:fimbrillin family protein [Elizabethkingia anophelis]
MKNIYTRRKICTLIILYAIVAVFISCSSRDDNPSNTVPPQAGTTILTFNIAGIVEENSITSIAKASVNNGSGNNSSMLSIAKNEIVSAGNFDVLTGAEGQRVTRNSDAVAATSSYYSGKINPVASTPMQTGVKYRLLVYDAVNNMLVKDVDGTVGTLPSIQVDAGRQYKWYAISTNSAITPTVNTTTGIVSGSLLANKDVLYNAGVVDAEYGQNNLNIIFKHYTSRIDVNLDTRGMFGTINNTTSIEVGTGTGSTFTNIIKTGDLNLFTAQYSNLQDVPAITAGNMVNTQGTGGALGASKTAIFYTVNQVQVASNNLRLRFGKLDLTMDDNTTRSFTNSIVPYSNTLFTPVLEGRYSINARLIESGVRVKGLLWARTNLTYDSGQADMYRLGVSNDQTSINANTNYWNWMSAIPTGPSSANVDPCTKIYPENT